MTLVTIWSYFATICWRQVGYPLYHPAVLLTLDFMQFCMYDWLGKVRVSIIHWGVQYDKESSTEDYEETHGKEAASSRCHCFCG